MGLLTDTRGHGKLASVLMKHCNKICFLCYVSGIIWFGLLAWEPSNNKTYFSENALLPGLVQREYSQGGAANILHESLQEEAKTHSSLPYAWLQGQFRQLGLDVYTHNFTLHYPFGTRPNYTGKNLYAILRAPRAASTEAVVFSTPYRAYDSIHLTTLPGIALMISLAKFFQRHTYWAKDIIFLITEHEMVGFQAWLDAYHETQSDPNILDCGYLEEKSGSIQAAINLEIHGERISHFDLKLEGLNGQLPNLDLVNLAVELCSRESIPVTFHDQSNPPESITWKGWKKSFRTMLSMMLTQSTGLPSGGHGLFHRYTIQALTLEGKTDGSTLITFNHMGRVLEGIFRSLNNLLERFHQSFFFYILPSTRRYISIGLYMPPFGLIAAPVLLKVSFLLEGPSLWLALHIVGISHIFGCLLYIAPNLLDFVGKKLFLSTEDAFYYGTIIVLIYPLSFTLYGRRLMGLTHDLRIYRCVALLELGAFLYTLSLINIAMATVLSIIYVPVAVTAGGAKSRFLSWPHAVLLLLLHPFILIYLYLIANSIYIDSTAPISEHLSRALKGHKKVLLFTIEDWYLYSNWNYAMASIFFLPAWLMLWLLPTV
ncbi:glycosylphosphatidylinositol anchor attachment 1 protein [Centruroides vittatus]|uniref:glycosylphosphatidylinositol anchor attachment 1 protein n=1 Tax=Centruroides vittatus TaxID=120091 RepID=UPI00350F6FCD